MVSVSKVWSQCARSQGGVNVRLLSQLVLCGLSGNYVLLVSAGKVVSKCMTSVGDVGDITAIVQEVVV